MVIYGTAMISGCMLIGVFAGDLLGKLLGVKANIGGVGIAIVLLLLLTDYLKKKNKLDLKSQDGIKFWSAMYIPIVVAMAAQQNVLSALKGGPVALLGAIVSVASCYVLVPILSRGSNKDAKELKPEVKESHL